MPGCQEVQPDMSPSSLQIARLLSVAHQTQISSPRMPEQLLSRSPPHGIAS